MDTVLYIDIEGFSATFETSGKQAMVALTNDIFTLLKYKYQYIAVYQFGGDGFLIKTIGPFIEQQNTLINIGITLLKSILIQGGIGRIQMSQGNMADISQLYSDEIIKAFTNQDMETKHFIGSTSINKNIFTINHIIGPGIINAFNLKGRSGPIFIIDPVLIEQNPSAVKDYSLVNIHGAYELNWLIYINDEVRNNLKILNLNQDANLNLLLDSYLKANILNKQWVMGAKSLK
jgi:hypothetical protein